MLAEEVLMDEEKDLITEGPPTKLRLRISGSYSLKGLVTPDESSDSAPHLKVPFPRASKNLRGLFRLGKACTNSSLTSPRDSSGDTTCNSLIIKQVASFQNLQCGNCLFKANSATSLRRHARMYHPNSACYTCRPATSPSARVYKCSVCDHVSNQRGNLVIHMRVHTNTRPFKCDKCSYAARQLIQLQRHTLHHVPSELCPHACPYCTYASKSKGTTSKHLYTVHFLIDNIPYKGLRRLE